MLIAIDITTLLDQYSDRGIGNYTKYLLRELLQDEENEWHLIGFETFEENLQKIGITRKANIHFHSIGMVKFSSVGNLWHSRMQILPEIKLINPDIVFSPNFDRGIFSGNWENVVMIHDLIPLLTEHYSDKSPLHDMIKGWFYRKQLGKALKNSSLVLTNSLSSKTEIVSNTGISEEKVLPIYLGIDDKFAEMDATSEKQKLKHYQILYGITEKYILYYGGIEKNKNIENVIHSYEAFYRDNADINLVIISDQFRRKTNGEVVAKSVAAERVLRLIKEKNLSPVIKLTGKVEREHLPYLLKNALAFLHLSMYEGFGLAVSEALSAGTPCVISDIPVYRELFDDCAIFTNPLNPNDVAAKLKVLISDKCKQDRFRHNWRNKSVQYNWKETARKTLEAFSKVNKEKKNKVSASIEEKRKSDIAFAGIYFYPFIGGVENYMLDIAKQLTRDGKKVSIYSSKFSPYQEAYEKVGGINVFRSSTWIDQYYLRFYPGLLMNLLRSDSKIIHAQNFGIIWQDICLIVKRFLSRDKVKFICTPHGPFMSLSWYPLWAKIFRTVYKRILRLYLNWLYDQVIMVNPNQAKWINGEYGVDLDKIKFLPIGLPERTFQFENPDSVIADYAIKKSDVVISFVGRFHAYKGVFNIINAAEMLKGESNNFKIFMIGKDSGELKHMRKMVIEKRLEENVVILEYPEDKVKNQILQLSEIFVFPSEWEAYGIAIIEAMARGNAVISTKTEGGLHLIKHNENGLLINYDDTNDLYKALKKLIGDKELREKMININIEKANSLKWESIWREYQAMYEGD